MRKTGFLIALLLSCLTVFGQSNSFPSSGNATIYQSSGTYRSYDVVNFNSNVVARHEATTDGTGQLWLRDAAGNYRAIIRGNNFPSVISSELILGAYTSTSKSRRLFVDGTSEFVGNVYGQSNVELKQASGSFRAYDVMNFNNHTVARFEATTNGTGQLWFRDQNGNYKVSIRAHATIPSSIAGELVLGEYATTSKGKKLYVKGDSWIAGKLGVDGQLRAEEVKVEVINGADFVFEPGYDLRSLEETKEFITRNKHLPEIPSAKEMETEGLELGQMNIRLLQKIEELTLYQIDLLEQLKQQQQELQQSKDRILLLEKSMKDLKQEGQ